MLSRLATTVSRRYSPQIKEYTADLAETFIKDTPQYHRAKAYAENNISNIIYKNFPENIPENKENVPKYMYTSPSSENRAKMLSENVRFSPLGFNPYKK